jgi:hypothetical protein
MAGTSPAMTVCVACAIAIDRALAGYSPSTALVMMLRWISLEPP